MLSLCVLCGILKKRKQNRDIRDSIHRMVKIFNDNEKVVIVLLFQFRKQIDSGRRTGNRRPVYDFYQRHSN